MGSTGLSSVAHGAPTYADSPLPSASSPSLVLAHATEQEKRVIWESTHSEWGSALDLDVYVKREAFMQTAPLSKTGGISNWILTTSSSPTEDRPILSSCETLRKRVLVSTTHKDGSVQLKEGLTHGVGSVFCEPQFRGKGYAGRMMQELGPVLQTHLRSPKYISNSQADGERRKSTASSASAGSDSDFVSCNVPFSILFSDIGKKFYAARGWEPHPATHLSFPPSMAYSSHSSTSGPGTFATPSGDGVQSLGYHDLAILTAADEQMLRRKLARPSRESRTRVAVIPDLDNMLWHLMREDYMTTALFGRTPLVRGALVGTEECRNRVWAVWTRNYYSPDRKDAHRNTLYILRLVMEDEDSIAANDGSDGKHKKKDLGMALHKIIDAARREAAEWHVGSVHLWDPSFLVRELVQEGGLEYEYVERDTESIPSLMWYGPGDGKDIEWVANEKYAWC